LEYRLHTHYSGLDTAIHRLDPRTKVILTFFYAAIVVSTPPTHLLAFVTYGGILSWVVALAHVPLSHIVIRAMAVLPFSLLAALWLPFLHDGPTVSLLGDQVQLSTTGLWLLAGVAMKSFLGASAAILLASTTPFGSLLAGLRKMGMPVILADMLTLTYRYLFVLVEEAMRLRRAAAARGYRPRWLGQAVLIGRCIGQLFVRSFERAERVYGAMILRGYRGQMPTSHAIRLTNFDLLALLLLVPALIAARTFLQ
jgi:cobalt/nickel transport system permease protein